MNLADKIFQLAHLLREAKYPIILTGAGMSTESGLADFRSSKGIWTKVDPIKLASREAMAKNYPEFREFYLERIRNLQKTSPNLGHKILASWEKKGLLKAVITQNVDGFHQKAGSKEVMELHGSLRKITCENCKCEFSIEAFIQSFSCQNCTGRLRPGVVLFGEGLPAEEWDRALAHLEQADFLLIIGTSLEVAPVNQIPLYLRGRGKQVIINRDPPGQIDLFELFLQGTAGEILSRVDEIFSEHA